jgi:hypothetical protein
VLGSSHRKDHGTGFLDELKDKAEDVIENVKDRVGGDDTPAENAGQRDAATAAAETGQDVGEFAPVGATEPEVAAVEDACRSCGAIRLNTIRRIADPVHDLNRRRHRSRPGNDRSRNGIGSIIGR